MVRAMEPATDTIVILDHDPSQIDVSKSRSSSYVSGVHTFQAEWLSAWRTLLPRTPVYAWANHSLRQIVGAGTMPAGALPHALYTFINAHNTVLVDLTGVYATFFHLRDNLHTCPPLMVFLHGLAGDDRRQRLTYALLRGLSAGDCIISPSQAGLIVIHKLIDEIISDVGLPESTRPDVTVIPIGIDTIPCARSQDRSILDRYSIPRGSTVALVFGRIAPFSKADLISLLLVWKDIAIPDSHLLMAGNTVQKLPNTCQQLAQICSAMGIDDRVTVVADPDRTTKDRLFASADYFIALSDTISETFGITLLEAGAYGLPTIAADWNGYREIILPDRTGILIPSFWGDFGDAYDGFGYAFGGPLALASGFESAALRQAIIALTSNTERRLSMGLQAADHIKPKYDWKVIVPRYCALIERLTSCGNREHRPIIRRYRPQRIFSHYSSRVTTESDVLILGPMADLWQGSSEPFSITRATQCYLDDDILNTLVMETRRAGRITIGELIEEGAKAHSVSHGAISYHIHRLLKCFVLQTSANTRRSSSEYDMA